MSGPWWARRPTRIWAISTAANNADYSALDAIDRKTAGVRVSAHVPEVASNKQNALIRLGMHDRAVLQVLWDGVTLIPDEITKAKTGEIAITAILLSRDQDPPRGFVLQAGNQARGVRARHAITVLSPVPAAMQSRKMTISKMS